MGVNVKAQFSPGTRVDDLCDSLLQKEGNMIRVDHDELLRLIAEARVSLGKAEGK